MTGGDDPEPWITLDFEVGCQTMVYWIATVWIANIEFNTEALLGTSLYLHREDGVMLP